jgi:cellulose synthase/poly-beta-1,6-N-acetylglucosamine synthase-like glycosyltransferase
MKKNNSISIVVITHNEESNISNCLDSLLKLDYSKENYEIIVVDGKSKDRTIQIVSQYVQKFNNVKLLIDEIGYQTTSRNLGIKDSKYEFIAFTDADCIIPENWIKVLVTNFNRYNPIYPNLAGVGGSNIPPKQISNFIKAIGIAYDSWLGSLGSLQAKKIEKDNPVFSLSCTNCLYDKSKLKEVGLFSTDKGNMGDDWVLGLKLKKKNYLLMGLKESFVWHKFRSSPKKFFKNMFLYGKVRAFFIRKYPFENSMKYFLPIIFLLAMLSTVLIFLNIIFIVPLIYFPIIFIYSLCLSIAKKSIQLTPLVFLVFILLHFGYGLGEIYGLRFLFKIQ